MQELVNLQISEAPTAKVRKAIFHKLMSMFRKSVLWNEKSLNEFYYAIKAAVDERTAQLQREDPRVVGESEQSCEKEGSGNGRPRDEQGAEAPK